MLAMTIKFLILLSGRQRLCSSVPRSVHEHSDGTKGETCQSPTLMDSLLMLTYVLARKRSTERN